MMDVVTGVRELPGGVRVTINDRIVLLLTRRDQAALGLDVGASVDATELRHTLLLRQYPDALNRAVRLLSVRARSSREIELRLTVACYLADTVEMVLTKLQNERLLDDRAFAQQWARERAAKQIGRARILQELRQKGIDDELAQTAVNRLGVQRQDEGALALAAKLLRRYHALPAAEARRKAIPAMRRRGYSYGEAQRALDRAAEENAPG